MGAGASGIAALKGLHERGLKVDCFEASDRVGGNWVFENVNGMSSAYRTLHINTSRARMEFADFPMPSAYPDFPHHTQIAAYFDAYVDHFGLRGRIRFRTPVARAVRHPQGGWTLTARGEDCRYDALVVANGHHWDERWPEPPFPGADEFAGEQIHAHAYKREDQLRGRKVVVVGMGNSAMDIAVDASLHAQHTVLAARRGAWVLPKYVHGKPLDRKRALLTNPRVPWKVRQLIGQLTLAAVSGPMETYGLPKPDHRLGEAHPTISGRILDRLAHGAITTKPNIARLHRHEIEFTDGSRVEADLVVYCTGYKVTFPFFDERFISAPDNHIELFRRVFHPEIPEVAFIGLLQPLGAIMPLAEAQGQWVAAYLRGEYHLPERAAMRADLRRDFARMARRYVASKRHTIQVDFDDYLHELTRERRAGEARARRAGFALPVAPRVAEVDRVP
ncbi:MAG TPA: NAD(P)-binding domain-containing protein [Solirubrobacteraceae bacterium]|nr:NAD(P)-binding domain-containing protein [Solirubrobacteraceae bacterium]